MKPPRRNGWNNRAGYYQPYSDLVIKLHLRRLTGWMDSTDRQALQAEMARVLQAQIAQTELSI